MHARSGPQKGQLHWRRPSLATLSQVLHHPIYPGAYAYGRRPVALPGGLSLAPPVRRRRWFPMDHWTVLIQDHLPAYITWAQYLKNQERLEQNQSGPDTMGAPAQGVAWLAGSLVCGMCGRRMHVPSAASTSRMIIVCGTSWRRPADLSWGARGGSIAAWPTRCFAPLEPAALELSFQARWTSSANGPRGRQLQQQVQRARYEVDLAERRDQAVDPANRSVAATLAQRWEEALRHARQCQEAYDRFLQDTPTQRQGEERARITAVAADIPALWQATGTTKP